MHDDLTSLFAYNRWANDRVVQAASRLSPEQYVQEPVPGWSSVRATLVHVADATVIWSRRLQGEPVAAHRATEDEYPTLDAAVGLLDQGQDAFERLVPTLTTERLATVWSYRNFQDQELSLPIWAVLRHVVNHATYHRGQIASKLKRLGVDPVPTDFVVWAIEQAGAGGGIVIPVEGFFESLRDRLVGHKVSYRRVACDTLLVYVDCEPGDGEGVTIWFDPIWHFRSPERVLVGSNQTGCAGQSEDETALDVAAAPLDVLIGKTIAEVAIEPNTFDLSVTFEGGYCVRTFVSDPTVDESWHIRDNVTRDRLKGSPEGLAIVPRQPAHGSEDGFRRVQGERE